MRALLITGVLLGIQGCSEKGPLPLDHVNLIPKGLTVISSGRSAILSWMPNPDKGIALYKIYISHTHQEPYSWHGSVLHPTSSYTVSGLFEGATYYFKVSAVTTNQIESVPTEPVAVTIGISQESEPSLQAIPGDGHVVLSWKRGEDDDTYSVYVGLSPEGPYELVARNITSENYTVTGLLNGKVYYYRVIATSKDGHEEDITSPVLAMPGNLLNFADNGAYYLVQYRVGEKIAQYRFNKKTVQGNDGLYEQFISAIRLAGVPITARPYPGGVAGLVLMGLGNRSWTDPPMFEGTIEVMNSKSIVLRYISREATSIIGIGQAQISFFFTEGRPYLGITQKFVPLVTIPEFYTSWNVFIAIGGQYEPRSRVVVPYDEHSYYIINGQALGIHYNPRIDTWSLRMGAEETPHAHITAGFFFANPREAQPLTRWSMANDYCDDGSGNPQDRVPYNLDRIRDHLYVNYQEDEGGFCIPEGLGYSWQNAETATRLASQIQPYVSTLYYWIGEDRWSGEYGLNDDSFYQFHIKKLHDALQFENR